MEKISLALLVALAIAGCDNGGDEPECNTLCDRTPTATPIQGGCVADFIESRGYDTDHPDCVRLSNAFAAGTATAAQCRACYGSIGVSGADCAAAEMTCFGGGTPDSGPGDSGPDAALPDVGPGVDGGPGDDAGPDDAGPDDDAGGDVETCMDLCALTPETSNMQALCASGAADELGYDTDNVPCNILAAAFATGTATTDQCNACYSSIGITDEDCRSIHMTCY